MECTSKPVILFHPGNGTIWSAIALIAVVPRIGSRHRNLPFVYNDLAGMTGKHWDLRDCRFPGDATKIADVRGSGSLCRLPPQSRTSPRELQCLVGAVR